MELVKDLVYKEEGKIMLLNKATIKSNRADWEAMGIGLPRFNLDEMIANTREAPMGTFWGRKHL